MLKKLTSRKFIISVIMIITLFFISDDSTMTEVCTTLISTVYMLSETLVDRSRAVKHEVTDVAHVSKRIDGVVKDENEQ